MVRLLHDLLFAQADRQPDAPAIRHRQATLNYAALATQVQAVANGLRSLDLARAERVAVYLPKRMETVAALFGAARRG